MLVRKRRKRDGRELARLEPVHGGGVNRHSLLWGDVRAVLQVVVLSLLLRFQPKPSQPTKVLPANGFVNSGAPSNPFAVVVRHVRPPIRFGLDVPENLRL